MAYPYPRKGGGVSEVRPIHHHRPLDDEAPAPDFPVDMDHHVLSLIRRAVKASEEGDFQATITELCHAVFVGTVKGRQGASDHDLICALRGIAGFGFPWNDPDRAA